MQIEIVHTLNFSDEHICDLLSMALNAGSFSTDCWVKSTKTITKPQPERITPEYSKSAHMPAGEYQRIHVPALGGTLQITTVDDTTFMLDEDKLKRGLNKVLQENPRLIKETPMDTILDMDDETADFVLQYALFDRAVYG